MTPRLRIAAACSRLGVAEVTSRCVDLLHGGEVDPDFLVTLGGAPAARLLAEGIPENQEYWTRVWAMRGLLWASPGGTVDVLLAGLQDRHWRVREMTCKVIARHRVGAALDALSALDGDPNPRVRHAAQRAAVRVIGAGV